MITDFKGKPFRLNDATVNGTSPPISINVNKLLIDGIKKASLKDASVAPVEGSSNRVVESLEKLYELKLKVSV